MDFSLRTEMLPKILTHNFEFFLEFLGVKIFIVNYGCIILGLVRRLKRKIISFLVLRLGNNVRCGGRLAHLGGSPLLFE